MDTRSHQPFGMMLVFLPRSQSGSRAISGAPDGLPPSMRSLCAAPAVRNRAARLRAARAALRSDRLMRAVPVSLTAFLSTGKCPAVLAWRINRHLASQPADADSTVTTANDSILATATEPPATEDSITSAGTQDQAQDDRVTAAGSLTTSVLPWVPGPRQVPADGQAAPLTAYLTDAATLITTRIQTLADTAVRLRQPWTSALGQKPDDPARAREWLRHVAVVAAYRDQHQVTSDNPRQVLGPYAEPGHAGHKAYWDAAESVLAARQLAGLHPANGTSADDRARAQIAADIYRSLPDEERALVASLVADGAGSVWLGDPEGPDEYAAAKSAYAPHLVSVLARRGIVTDGSDLMPEQRALIGSKPCEAELARRGRPEQRKTGRPVPEPGARSRSRRATTEGSGPGGLAGHRQGSCPLVRPAEAGPGSQASRRPTTPGSAARDRNASLRASPGSC
jgi:hypothetical protein